MLVRFIQIGPARESLQIYRKALYGKFASSRVHVIYFLNDLREVAL